MRQQERLESEGAWCNSLAEAAAALDAVLVVVLNTVQSELTELILQHGQWKSVEQLESASLEWVMGPIGYVPTA